MADGGQDEEDDSCPSQMMIGDGRQTVSDSKSAAGKICIMYVRKKSILQIITLLKVNKIVIQKAPMITSRSPDLEGPMACQEAVKSAQLVYRHVAVVCSSQSDDKFRST